MATDIALPQWMPTATQRGYGHELESAVNRMDVELGPPRQWPTVRQQPRVISVEWVISWALHARFDQWFHEALLGGALPFDLRLADGRANKWHTAYFMGMPEAKFMNRPLALLNANLYCVGPSFLARSDDVSFTATLRGGLRIYADGTQAILFTADLAGALSIAALGSLNLDVDFEALLDGELDSDVIGTEIPGASGPPNGGDLERIWVGLARTPVPGSEIDRSNQELLQRTWMGLHHGFH